MACLCVSGGLPFTCACMIPTLHVLWRLPCREGCAPKTTKGMPPRLPGFLHPHAHTPAHPVLLHPHAHTPAPPTHSCTTPYFSTPSTLLPHTLSHLTVPPPPPTSTHVLWAVQAAGPPNSGAVPGQAGGGGVGGGAGACGGGLHNMSGPPMIIHPLNTHSMGGGAFVAFNSLEMLKTEELPGFERGTSLWGPLQGLPSLTHDQVMKSAEWITQVGPAQAGRASCR